MKRILKTLGFVSNKEHNRIINEYKKLVQSLLENDLKQKLFVKE